jgi:hypothetical protein
MGEGHAARTQAKGSQAVRATGALVLLGVAAAVYVLTREKTAAASSRPEQSAPTAPDLVLMPGLTVPADLLSRVPVASQLPGLLPQAVGLDGMRQLALEAGAPGAATVLLANRTQPAPREYVVAWGATTPAGTVYSATFGTELLFTFLDGPRSAAGDEPSEARSLLAQNPLMHGTVLLEQALRDFQFR